MTDSDSNKTPQENSPSKHDANSNAGAPERKESAVEVKTGQESKPSAADKGASVTKDKASEDIVSKKNVSESQGSNKESKDKAPKDKNDQPKPAPKAPDRHKPKRGFPIVAVVALIVGAAAGGAGYVNYTRWQASHEQSQALATANTQLRSQLDTLQQQISGLQREDLDFKLKDEQLGSDLKLQNDSVKQLSQQLQAFSAEQGRDPLLWRVAEVEYLLSVANNRLQLERDSDTALVALQDADKRLEAIGDPALIPIRKTIAGEINALNSVQKPDITGMALRLSSLEDGIEKLPLVSRERIQSEEPKTDSELVNSFSQFWANLLKDLKGVVSIRRAGEPIEPLLPPDEQYYLSQNLALKLEEARLALLNRDTQTFRQDLTDTRQWLDQYFDKDSTAVSNVITTIDNLQSVDLKPELPDISSSLRQLRHWMALQQHSVKPTPATGNPDKG